MRTFCNVLLATLLFLSTPVFSQEVEIPTDTTQLSSIETKDGNEFVGYIRAIEADVIVVKTEDFGDVRIRRQNVKTIQPLAKNQIVAGEYWPYNPYASRYFFAPNGYGLRKGEGYYQNTWIFFNQVSYGFSDNFSLGVGIVPLFLFEGTATPIWITPKLSIPLKKDRFNLGLGGLFAVVAGEESASFGVAYGQATVGSRDRNISVGLGYGYAGDSWASTPTISLSGVYRTGKKFAIMTENYLFDTGDESIVLLSAGGRFIGKRVAIDAGLVFPTATDGYFIAVPWLGITVPFGKRGLDR
jgi:hypothetical protein